MRQNMVHCANGDRRMSYKERDRDTILLCPGPEYLFWALGVYFAWELSRNYRVVLIADHCFEDVERVQGLLSAGVLHDFLQYPTYQNSFLGIGKAYSRHRYFKRLAEEVFTRYSVAAVVQHTDLEPSNIYLFRKAASENCLRVMYHSSAVAKDYYEDNMWLYNWAIAVLQKELGTWRHLAVVLFNTRRISSYYFNYWLMPLLLTGWLFRPRIGPLLQLAPVFNGNPGYFDSAVIYSIREKSITEANGVLSDVVQNPLFTCGNDANNYLFPGVTEKAQIIVLPTSAEFDQFFPSVNGTEQEYIKLYASIWAEAISVIQKQFPGHATFIKCHPMGVDDAIFDEVIIQLDGLGCYASKINNSESAEKYILESTVIVGTMSSTLWWASELQLQNTVISLDLWNITGGDKCSEVGDILYVKTMAGLRAMDFSKRPEDHSHKASFPTLTAHIKQKYAEQFIKHVS